MESEQLMTVALEAAQAGAEEAMRWQRRPADLVILEKTGPRDLVSAADLATERAIRDVLGGLRPQDAVLGEEQGRTGQAAPVEWLVDPIDGTTSFLYGRPDWAVSVAARGADGQLLAAAVAEPSVGRLSWAGDGLGAFVDGRRAHLPAGAVLPEALVEVNLGRPREHHPHAGAMVDALLPRVRDLRRGGSAAAALAAVAGGRADAVWSPGLQPWDGAAGVLLVVEAGGVVGDLGGRVGGRWPDSGDVLAARPELWDELRHLLDGAYPPR